MMIGVVLPLGFMMFRNKRAPSSSSSSSFSKQT
ncbi:GTP cyclohydrolase FolE2 [Bienertia sinuspersici]